MGSKPDRELAQRTIERPLRRPGRRSTTRPRLRSLPHPVRADYAAWPPASTTVPTVVDLDQSEASLGRAEWIDGALLLRLVAADEDPGAWITFRIIGAEPRLWYLTGIDRAWMDVTSSAVIMRVPRVSGTLELTPGSY